MSVGKDGASLVPRKTLVGLQDRFGLTLYFVNVY